MNEYTRQTLETLARGEACIWQLPEDGDLACMRGALKHGQILTLSPITDLSEIQVGDYVYLKWHGSYILHIVQEIQGEQFLIINSLGKVNGWTHGSNILGRVTKIVDPPPFPGVPELLQRLEDAVQRWASAHPPGTEEVRALLAVLDDMRWYARRIGPERWERWPCQNRYSFRWHLWHITREFENSPETAVTALRMLIDHAKQHVGWAAELIRLWDEPSYTPE